MKISTLLHATLRLLFPQLCCVCGERLYEGESCICSSCFLHLPLTKFYGKKGNAFERLFWQRLPIVRANAYMYYLNKSGSRRPILSFKYYDRPETALFFGEVMGHEVDNDFFEGMDAIVPVPLAPRRYRHRGYNQSEVLAQGIATASKLPIWADCVARIKETLSQTQFDHHGRQANMVEIFQVVHPEKLRHKHILLVDDVFTTGATICSLAQELSHIEGLQLSIMVLAVAHRLHLRRGLQRMPKFGT